MNKFVITIHGGAGIILRSQMIPEREVLYKKALEDALRTGYTILEKGGTALDAVESAVMSLEDCPLFNAGKGSVFTNEGKQEMDASIMDGSNLKAGAVSALRTVRNPVHLARTVMEESEHVMLCGAGAESFARKMNLQFENEDYFFDQVRYDQWLKVKDSDEVHLDHNDDKKYGTVGAAALDIHGNLAAATSTGGMTNKRFGRVGDSPIIGAGTYANNATCAISCTGHGEYFMRAVVAYDISCLMEYKGLSLKAACDLVVNKKLTALGGDGGLIAVDGHGNHELVFNCEGMYRGVQSSGGEKLVAIYGD